MPDSFDPYHEWLGIPPEDRPANHYRLLGIADFESKLSVIEHAADRQMAHVRSLQSGQHRDASQALLNEVASAKICLLNTGRKQAYDQKLRESQSAISSSSRWKSDNRPAQPPPNAKAPAPKMPPVRTRAPASAPQSRPVPASPPVTATGKRSSAGLLIGGAMLIGLVLSAVVGVAAFVAFWGLHDDATFAENKPPSSQPTNENAAAAVDASIPGDAGEADDKRQESESSTTASQPEEPPAESKPTPISPQAGDGSVDLLAVLEPEFHTVSGEWQKTGGRLSTTASEELTSEIELPVVFPTAYELKLAVTRKAGNGELRVGIVLPNGQPAFIFLDGAGGSAGLSGNLQFAADSLEPALAQEELQLPIGETKLVLCRVQSNDVSVSVDGEMVFQWQGAFDEFVALDRPSTGSAIQGYLLNDRSGYQFDVLQFTALRPDEFRPPPTVAPPRPIARWTFDGDLRDQIGTMHGTAFGSAQVSDGRLRLDGRSYVRTNPLQTGVSEMTLEVWLAFADGLRPATAVMALSQEDHDNDAIAFAGSHERQWAILDSDSNKLSLLGGAEETAREEELIHLAFVYDQKGAVTAYRNGTVYGRHSSTRPATLFEPSNARVFFGRLGRSLPHGFVGYIEQAQLFSEALSAGQVALLASQKPADSVRQRRQPEPIAVEAAAARLRETYATDLASTSAVQRQQFAKRLFALAEHEGEEANQFAAFALSRDLFAQLGDMESAAHVVDRLAEEFAIAPSPMRLDVLLAAAKRAEGVQLVSIARYADQLFVEAIKCDDFELAQKILRIANGAAKTTNQSAISARCRRRQIHLAKYEAAFDAFQHAMQSSDGAAAGVDKSSNQAAGMYLCFVREQFDSGLAYLAEGDDVYLSELAGLELAESISDEQAYEIANRWWNAADKAEDHLRPAMHRRAAYWYRFAAPNLNAVDRDQAMQRLQQLATAENEGWHVFYRSASASLWGMTIDDQDVYSASLDTIPADTRYLRIRRMDNGQFVVIAINAAVLRTGGAITSTLLWHTEQPRIGIVSAQLPVANGKPWIANGVARKNYYGGWGYGEMYGEETLVSTWRGQSLGGVSLEFAVTSQPLMREDEGGLLR